MAFAKQPASPPQFDAGAFAKHAGLTDADIKNFQAWKQYLESSGAYALVEAGGIRGVVKANAQGMNALKADYDAFHTLTSGQITTLFEEVTALKNRPAVPFPESS